MADAPTARPVVLESGIEVPPAVAPPGGAPAAIGAPGEFPYTRGIHPLMYRRQPWTMRQYAGFGSPERTNERFRLLIGHGQDALNVALDLPTQMGLDSDDPAAADEVGRVGMAVDTVDDLARAFDGIPLGKVSVSLTVNATAPVLFAMFLAVAEDRGVPPGELRGTLQNDILKEFLGRGAWIYPVEPSVRLVVDVIEHAARHCPRYHPVSVCGYHLRESGATPAQEAGWALEIARAYLDGALARGLPVDSFAPRFSFNFNVFGNLWEQVAKFRAVRRLWARMLRDELGARDPRSWQLKMIAGGGGSGLTAEEPLVNVVRGAYYALAAALGGAQTMALCCYDEAYTIPSAEASLLSLRTMQVLAEETGVADVADPLGGSWFVEWLTDRMEERIAGARAEVRGRLVAAIRSGELQRALGRGAYDFERRVRAGEIPRVGVNRHVPDVAARPAVALHPYDPAEAERKVRELRRAKATRESGAVAAALDGVRRAAEKETNVVPPILEAVRARATVGEVSAALRSVFGTYEEPPF